MAKCLHSIRFSRGSQQGYKQFIDATIKELLGNQPQWKCPSILRNIKRGQEMAASRVMGPGELRWPGDEAADPR